MIFQPCWPAILNIVVEMDFVIPSCFMWLKTDHTCIMPRAKEKRNCKHSRAWRQILTCAYTFRFKTWRIIPMFYHLRRCPLNRRSTHTHTDTLDFPIFVGSLKLFLKHIYLLKPLVLFKRLNQFFSYFSNSLFLTCLILFSVYASCICTLCEAWLYFKVLYK